MFTKSISVLILIFELFIGEIKADNGLKSPTNYNPNVSQISFIENKGQVSDQNYRPRPDVLFSGTDGQLVFYLKNNGISYQLNRVDQWKKQDSFPIISHSKNRPSEVPEQITTYRLDVNWLNANTGAGIVKGEAMEGHDNFYLTSCPKGALEVKSYKQITFQKLYPGIDLKWYEKNGHLKYDYIVAAGTDYKQIQLEIKGSEKISVNKNGELIIKTPLGEIIEQAPLVIQNGKQLKANWVINNGIVSFEIKNVDSSQVLVIDPMVRLWATYYGGSLGEYNWTIYVDGADNVYLPGSTKSLNNIATVGAYQTSYSGGGINYGDAFLVKFNSAGVRQWATYYGGTDEDAGSRVVTDIAGNVYMVGATSSTNAAVIATPGSHQPLPSGAPVGWWGDGFIVKFNSSGIRQWGTFYGGEGGDWIENCTMDNAGDLYITGVTSSTANIATPGSHQPNNGGGSDAFLIKFSSSGVRLWATYYGGSGTWWEGCGECKTDAAGNVFFVGATTSPNAIATPGSHQPVYGGGGQDAYLAKFNSSGVRQWGTYYGGAGGEYAWELELTSAGDIYISGQSSSTAGISTVGSHQANYGGGPNDAFLVKFNTAGIRQWGTYYGGIGDELGTGVSVDASSDICISGNTSTSTGTVIATPCTYQQIFGGGSSDVFLAKFTPNGSRIWGTYYGGLVTDNGGECRTDTQGNVYLTGTTLASSGTIIASANGHQPIYGGGLSDSFLAKFNGCKPPPNTTPPSDQIICFGESTTLTSTLGCGINWYNAIGGNSIGTGSTINVSPVSTTTFYIDDVSCGLSNNPTPVTVTVNPLPNISISADNTVVCSGSTVNLNATGGTNYTWSPGGSNSPSLSLSPTASISYSVEGDDGFCSNTATILIDVVQIPTLALNYLPGPYCYSTVVSFSASGAQSYSWLPASSISSTNNSGATSLPLEANTTFTLIGSNTNGVIACLNDKIISLNVLQGLNTQISNSVTICQGDKTNLDASGGNTYHWLPETAINNPSQSFVTVNPAATTIYSVGISYNNLCPQTRTVLVHVVPTPFVSAGNDTIINIGDQVSLTASGDGIIKWISGENLSCYDCRVTNILPFTRTCYEVELTDQNGCKAVDDVCIEIINDFGVYIPNTFTPNTDGMNDVFEISYYGIKEIKLIIYDRWGVQLFSTNDLKNNWDGTHNGKICQVGTYVYKLEYEPYKGKSGERVGHVNLVR